MQPRWILAPAEELNGGAISWDDVCGLPCIARLLLRKGFTATAQINDFLRPRLAGLSDPFLIPNMELAIRRILAALDARERIVLFGDYDVDGITSLALLHEMLLAYGAAPELFLPLRMEEGYGLSSDSVERCLEQHRPKLLIAVDCGTSSVEEIAGLERRGVDVVVLDHHEPKSALPVCVAVVNPKTDPGSPFHYLCSVGIVFKLCHGLLKTRPAEFDLKAHLDLVALGTVADIVPLQGENRTLVQRGMLEIPRSKRPGVRMLMEVAGVRPPIVAEDIGFRLGPRLNAAGRLSTAEKSLRLLLTSNAAEAAALAEFLDKQNRERQEIEKQTLVAAEEKIALEFDAARDAAIVVGAPGWHPGVLGIVASRISRKYHRPTIVIGFDETGSGKGSGRSIPGFSLVQALQTCGRHLEKFGGHEMAAGLTVFERNIPAFSEAFREVARERIAAEDLEPRLLLDHEVAFSELNLDLLYWHDLLQPFGNGNPQPLFLARRIESVAPPKLVNEKHLVLRLRQRNFYRRGIYFDGAAFPLPPAPWDMAFRISAHEYEGNRQLDVHIQALRSASPNE